MAGHDCTTVTALQLAAVSGSFLLAVLLLDALWVRLPYGPREGGIAQMLRRQGILNLFVACGAAGAAVLLLVWTSACGV